VCGSFLNSWCGLACFSFYFCTFHDEKLALIPLSGRYGSSWQAVSEDACVDCSENTYNSVSVMMQASLLSLRGESCDARKTPHSSLSNTTTATSISLTEAINSTHSTFWSPCKAAVAGIRVGLLGCRLRVQSDLSRVSPALP
jgi:hypothetical protein